MSSLQGTRGKYYITTPIYYPSDNLHIGHAYTTTATDAFARFKRMTGYDVMFLTGMDEHGQKIQKSAEDAGENPQAYVDRMYEGITSLWKLMGITYDDFIRTTEPRHKEAVQKIFTRLFEQGDIYKGEYEGWYCRPCESFWLDRQLVDGKCPDCGREVDLTREESYFFKLSKYADRLIEHINTHPEFIQPVSRKNEMLNNFLLPGLDDLAVSRTSFDWGIKVPFDDKHVVYVWLDALSNYISALGYTTDDDSKFQKYWPADVQLMAKEIVRFHTIIWPIMLMALDLPLPKRVFAHGWLTMEDGKMSKSKGNVIDPVVLCDKYGVDAVRYYLLRVMPFGNDGMYSEDALIARTNTDLANDLGNLLSRTVAMIEKYFGGSIPARDEGCAQQYDTDLIQLAQALPAKVEACMDDLHIPEALDFIWELIGASNKYIDLTSPWILGRDEAQKPRLGNVLYNLAESLRIIGLLLQPYMPKTSEGIFAQLGIGADDAIKTWDTVDKFGCLQPGTRVHKMEALFPRIEVEKKKKQKQGGADKQKQAARQPAEDGKKDEYISYDEFMKVELRTAKVLECGPLEGADKLLLFKVDDGQKQRSIVSGIRKWYGDGSGLVGKTVIIVANLKPTKIRGVVSEGMILSAADDADENLSVSTLLSDEDVPIGARVR